jgi:putative ABC transport system permease protein
MHALFQDLKYAYRQLARTPGFTFAAVFALALGIGANIVIFSTVNAVLLNSLPFRSVKQPERLVSVYETNASIAAFLNGRLPVRLKNFLAWKKQADSFTALEAYEDTHFDLTSTGSNGREPEQVNGVTTTPGLLRLLGIAPRLGRSFTDADMQPGRDHVAIISDELWRSRFSADPHILGRTIRASGVSHQIIGVLPPGFELPATDQGLDQSKPKLWIPMNLHPITDDENRKGLTVLGYLKPGVMLAQACAEMKIVANRLSRQYPDTNRGWGINVFQTISEDVDPDVRTGLFVLQVAVGFVLLIACANVANLLLTKAVAREKEIAVRVAIGASRWRIIQQNLTESLLLSFVAGALGLLLSFGGLRLIAYLAPKDTHGFHELRIDPLILAFTLGITLAAGILFGLAPSFHSLRQNIVEALSRGSRSVAGSSKRFRAALVVAEIALSLILLAGAGLTIRSLVTLMDQDTGFRPDHLLTMSIALPGYRYTNPQQVAAFDDQLLTRVQQLPGVEAASLATALPMRSISEQSYELPGVPSDPNKMKVTDWARVTEQHVQALGLHLLAGRNLMHDDVYAARPDVALVNEAFARANWPGQKPLGKVFVFGGEDGRNINYRVVGLVSNAHQFGPDATPHPEVYFPSHHMQNMSLVVRTPGDPLALANAVKQQVWAIDKEEPVSQVDSMENMLSEWVAPRRFIMTVLINFGVIALILAAVGLYSVLGYAVSLRTREIGVRVALGAEPRSVAALILRQAAGMTLLGVALGLAGAFVLIRFMQSLIYGISAFDVPTFAGVTILLLAIAALASYIPARRAAGIQPMEALRSE